MKIKILVDARGLPVAVHTASALSHETKLLQQLFDLVLTLDAPEWIIGDKAFDSNALDDELDDESLDMIAPHGFSHRPVNGTQDGLSLSLDKHHWTVERTASRIQNIRRLCIRYGKSTPVSQGFLHLGFAILLIK